MPARNIVQLFSLTVSLFIVLSVPNNAAGQSPVGIFDGHADVGAVLHAGSATYDSKTQRYELSGSGSNVWNGHDEMHYAWKRIKGDFILQARGVLIGKGVEEHRKFGWMIRNSLDTSSAEVCVALHGNGLTSLQYRKALHANMEQDTLTTRSPDMIQLERKGKQYIMSVARFGDPYTVIQTTAVNLEDEVYVGLFICAHNKDVTEKVTFDNVRIIVPAKDNFAPYRDYIGSRIEIMTVADGNRKAIYSSPESLQAPNWTPDNKDLIYNSSKGIMYKLNLATLKTEEINTDTIRHNNNDHVLSFDGKMLGLSSRTGEYNSLVYTVPTKGGTPKLITPTGPSYLHSWSPDGKYLIFTAERKNNNFDIYKVSADGGKEQRLTTDEALDDGSEYTPDGKYIYFNSTRTGLMQLWRMKPDGSGQEQVTKDEYNNWFAHISPDGKWIAFISYQKDIVPTEHPFYKHVYIRVMPVTGGQPKIVAYLYGGQGSMNTPSWSPDSKKIAFVSNTVIEN